MSQKWHRPFTKRKFASSTLYQTDLRITNNRSQKSPPSFGSFHSKLESNDLYVDRNLKFFEGIFSTPAIFKATSKVFRSQGCSDDKHWLNFFQHFLQDLYISQFNSFVVRFHEATLESGLIVAWFSSTSHNSLLRTGTNEIASFCIDNRLRQMALFFVFAKVDKGGANAGFRVMLKYFEVVTAFRYYIKQIDSMLPCVCSVIDHRRRQNVVRTSVRGVEQRVKSPLSLLSEPISPSSLLFEPISPSSININFSFSPSSLLFRPISPSSQLCLGHFSLLPILFLPPHQWHTRLPLVESIY